MLQCRIIWLDANSSDPLSSFRTKLGNAQTFTDANECVQYIKTHPDDPIYLIVSGTLAKVAVPEIYECSNLLQIFLFCGSVMTYAEWAMDYSDKIMIFNHGDDLLQRLWNELHTYFSDYGKLCLKHADEFKQRALQYRQPCG